MKFKRAMKHTIVIEPSANGGFHVSIGCCHLTYTDPSEMVQDLRRFLENPELVEREYLELENGVDINQPTRVPRSFYPDRY